MKQTSSKQTTQHCSQDTSEVASAGPNGVAVTPPDYGIEALDSEVGQPEAGFYAGGGLPLQRKADPSANRSELSPRLRAAGTLAPDASAGVAHGPQSRRPPSGEAARLPDNLKSGVESLSGLSLDDVRVHYNSPKPAGLQALAYTQGADIHVAPGQERHLPHEAWHVVQQKQGRVKPTMQMRGTQINDNIGLEREADRMGEKALSPSPKTTVTKDSSVTDDIVQMVWNPLQYDVDNSTRTMYVDMRQVIWGGTAGPGNHINHQGNIRAILFETISRRGSVAVLMNRLNQNAMWDTGLTVVANESYTPDNIYDVNGQPTGRPKTEGNNLQPQETALDQDWTQMNNTWNGMPVQIVTAVWERRQIDRDGNLALENVQGSVPYSTFRRLAATNPGATAIEDELRSNHEQVWRKMGDDDMPYVDPNAHSPEIGKLQEVEDLGMIYAQNTFVTFGYNLTTAGTQPPITGILQDIYRKEMELRDKIAELGAPMYPSEPTTFYRPRDRGTMDVPWQTMEGQQVGGSGQQLEGAKLIRAMKEKEGGGYKHYTFHSIMVNTGAGERNDALVALLSGWYNNGNGDPATFTPDPIENAINNLDQSALREGEYLNKVVGNLGSQLDSPTFNQIKNLVRTYRRQAAEEACDALKAAIPPHVRQQHQNQRFLQVWNQIMLERNTKFQ